ncbi:MAG TPA: hypothetical protein VM942_10620 [Acidimicrobiales bacterium]|nr:hypothetical protein [Acidimicrobiales bacterium]
MEGETMAKSLEDARKRLEDEFGQVRRHLDKIHDALNRVEAAGPEDDISELLEDLEQVVKEVRDGGAVGSGAHGHRRARREYLELKEG